jgi:MFS family permease
MNYKKSDALVPVSIGLTQGLATVFFTVVATRLGANPFLIGIISSSPYLGNLFAPLWSSLTEKIKINKELATAIFLGSVVILLLAFTRTPLIFTILVAIYFILFGAWDVLYPALVDILYSELAVKIIARFDELRSISYTLIVALSGFIMDFWGHRTTFFMGAAALVVAGIFILRSEPKGEEEDLEKTNIITIIREDPDILKLVSIFMIAGTGMLMMLPAIPILEVNVLKLSDAKIGVLFAVNSVSYILGMEMWSRYVKSVPRLYVTFTIGLISIITMALIYAFIPNYLMLIVANIFCGVGESSISFFWQTFSISNPDYRTEDLSSLHLFTCGVRGIYAPLIGSLIITAYGVKANFISSVVLILFALIVFLITGRNIFED